MGLLREVKNDAEIFETEETLKVGDKKVIVKVSVEDNATESQPAQKRQMLCE